MGQGQHLHGRAACRQKILLIEDNDQNRYMATFLLEKPIDPETFVANIERHLAPPNEGAGHDSNIDR